MSIRVLVADDHEVPRCAIRTLLERDPKIQVIAEAEDLSQTLRATIELKPEVVVMDLYMLKRHKIENAEAISLVAKAIPKLIAMSFANDEEAQQLAALCRAAKLLDKMKLSEELIPAIHQSVCAQRSEGGHWSRYWCRIFCSTA
jgi:DNA-binding NarL/FixJ family response regulator